MEYLQGILFGVYDTGPWLGIKMRGNDFIGWIGAGLQTYNLMVANKLEYFERYSIHQTNNVAIAF